jgi:Methyltransferase domain
MRLARLRSTRFARASERVLRQTATPARPSPQRDSGDLDEPAVRELATAAPSRLDLWRSFIVAAEVRVVAEIGVYRGRFAASLLEACPGIDRYYMIDPWRHLDDWNKPANKDDDEFQRFYDEALEKTAPWSARRVVLRGTTTEVIDQVADGALDFAYVDGDHTLRGITIDLLKVYPKVRDGGWIGGDDFARSIWQHDESFEPTLVFPYAVHFAEAMGVRIYALTHRQFLLHKRPDRGFAFVDLTGKYGSVDIKSQLARVESE